MNRFWFIYLSLFLIASVIEGIGNAQYTTVDVEDIDTAVQFNVDSEAVGSGELGLPRPNSLTFYVQLAPKLVTWNFQFLTGDFQIVQYTMIFIFGGLFALSNWDRLVGIFRRNR